MLVEVEAPLAEQMREARLPRPSSAPEVTRSPVASGAKPPVIARALVKILVEVVSLIGPPELRQDQHVGVKSLHDLKDSSGSTPAIDTGVKVERRDTHRQTLPGPLETLWQSLMVEYVDVTFGHRLWWVDAFVGESERGNPAVVVLLERPLPDDELHQIAFEMGVSETAFVRRAGDQWSLRSFTPTVEVELFGHATLAALHVLVHELEDPASEFIFATRFGVLSGRRLSDGLLGVDLPRARLEPMSPSVLGGSLGDVRECYQAGPHIVLVVVEDYESLCGLNVDPMSLFLVPSSMVVAVCVGGPGVDASIRVFAPRLGVAEDHVTGSALCAVAPWWVEKAGSPTIMVRQASSRGGVMYARLFERNVEVAGEARTFFSGEIR